ncbi:arginyltransferase [Oceanisphaera avium]|uniref:Aspartate/glutamate leucyltransferase n=1 Tax=Oceanisphaera avium TaxID=1903694 RepID=A0A1Y0CWE2_9GAMM|nr:arginyltransferase [Oceanisphaera avium]ART79622.1 arginyltransferase [Oceanisphaera avium]
MKALNLKVGVTPAHNCSYLPHQQEQLLVVLDKEQLTCVGYEQLLSAGFRRSGNDLYRPHCQHCQACESLRIPVANFKPSRSQKRIQRLNRDVEIKISQSDKPGYFSLYQTYIGERHRDGTMFPPSRRQYECFLLSEWHAASFIEFWLAEQLIGVAVTDRLSHAMSALYTFFEPSLAHRSLGTFAILSQLALAKQAQLSWLYLGYQVDECAKMNYKQHFKPHQRLRAGTWLDIKD